MRVSLPGQNSEDHFWEMDSLLPPCFEAGSLLFLPQSCVLQTRGLASFRPVLLSFPPISLTIRMLGLKMPVTGIWLLSWVSGT